MPRQKPEWKATRNERLWEKEQKATRKSFIEKEWKISGRAISIYMTILYVSLAALFLLILYFVYHSVCNLAEALQAPEGSPLKDQTTWYTVSLIFWLLWAYYLPWKFRRLFKKNKENQEHYEEKQEA